MADATKPVPVWNHANDKRGNGVIATACVMFALSTLTVGARLFTRFRIVKKVGIEEGCIIIAWLFAGIVLGDIFALKHFGLAHRITELQPEQITGYLQWFWVLIWTYNVSLNATKFSIVFQYRRIFVTDWFQIVVKVMLGILTVYGMWTVFGCVFICWPIHKFWSLDPTSPGKCLQNRPVFLANSYMNIITDLMIILSPMPVLNSLHMPKRQKIALGGIFAAGAFICVFSIVRLYLLYGLLAPGADPIYMNYSTSMWSIMEINVAIITASAPSLRALAVHIFPGLGSSRGGSKPTYGKSTQAEKGRGTINVTTHVDMQHEGGVMQQGLVMEGEAQEDEEMGGQKPKVNVMTTITAEVPGSSDGESQHRV